MRRLVILLIVIVVLLSAANAAAMSSAHYRLDWFTPVTSSGGGMANSTHYAVNLTIGQSVINSAASVHYKMGLGYWYGVAGNYRVFLPLILK